MTFKDLLAQVIDWLRQERRVSYGALRRQFELDDSYLADLQEELIYAKRLAVDEDGRVLVWVGEGTTPEPIAPVVLTESQASAPPAPEAERRQLTVMFCDLADSTRLSGQLDPEDLRDVIPAYQEMAAAIQRYDGYIAQYLGDGLLVYFGWPQAHEDDARRAVHAALGIVEALGELNVHLDQTQGVRLTARLGIHTGPVVIGEIGSVGRHEHLALEETTNIAARLEGLAEPATVVISDTTSLLVAGYFRCDDLGTHTLKGVTTPMQIYRVRQATSMQNRLEVALSRGLTPLVGRQQEVGLLLNRWTQVKEGQGQVVVLSGEAGIGKSRLVQVLKEHVAEDTHVRLEGWIRPITTILWHSFTEGFDTSDLREARALLSALT